MVENAKHELLWSTLLNCWDLYVISDKTRVYFDDLHTTVTEDRYAIYREGNACGYFVVLDERDIAALLD